MAEYCEKCGAPVEQPKGSGRPRRFCGALCQKQAARGRGCDFFMTHRGRLYRRDLHLMAFDTRMVPRLKPDQAEAFDAQRPAWHAYVYGGKRRA